MSNQSGLVPPVSETPGAAAIDQFLAAAFDPASAPIWGAALVSALSAIGAAFLASWLTNRQNVHLNAQQRAHELHILNTRHKAEASSIAVVLTAEIMGAYSQMMFSEPDLPVRLAIKVLRTVDEDTVVYEATLPNLGLLQTGTAEKVIQFYTRLRMLASMARKVPADRMPAEPLTALSNDGRSAAPEAMICLENANGLCRDARLLVDHLCNNFSIQRPIFDGRPLVPSKEDLATRTAHNRVAGVSPFSGGTNS